MTDILVIPDAHNKPGISDERFKWLGRLAAERRPDTIVSMGDHGDFSSLSSYDIGKKSFEGRTYKADVKAHHHALDVFEKELARDYDRDREARKKTYSPNKLLLGGNHDEGRIRKVIDGDRRLEGTIGVEDLHRPGWDWVPFLQPVELQGIFFCHYFVSGVMGKPVGGEHPGATLISKMHKSCVAAHSHLYNYAERTTVDGQKIQGLIAGCFLEENQWEAYAGQSNLMWRNCVSYLHSAKNGTYDLEMISHARLKETYS